MDFKSSGYWDGRHTGFFSLSLDGATRLLRIVNFTFISHYFAGVATSPIRKPNKLRCVQARLASKDVK